MAESNDDGDDDEIAGVNHDGAALLLAASKTHIQSEVRGRGSSHPSVRPSFQRERDQAVKNVSNLVADRRFRTSTLDSK